MDNWIISLVESLGYGGIVFLMVLENVFPPIPSELIMPVAGFIVQNGRLTFLGVVVAGTLGATLGALPLYYLGWMIGERRLRRFANHHGRWLAFSCNDIDRAKAWFKRHGRKTVLLCRVIPGIRSLISIPAGLNGMPLGSFLAYTTAGTAVWSALLAGLGYFLGGQYEKVGQYIDPITYAVIGIIVVIYLYRVIRHEQGEEEPPCD